MSDTDGFSTLEILAMTALGESESLGDKGMQQTINVVMNRTKANLHWMGGNDARTVCLQPGQFDCWNAGSSDRERIINIATNNHFYRPYVIALVHASHAIGNSLPDITGDAVSYYDSDGCPEPYWAKGKSPCLIDGKRVFFNLAAVA